MEGPHYSYPHGGSFIVHLQNFTQSSTINIYFLSRVAARPCGLHLRDPCAVGVIQGTETSPSDAPCSVTVSQTDQGHAISAIDVLCSARFMELYSVHGDYICTSEGVRIDGEVEISGQDGQEKLYCLQHSFDVPMMSFILKVCIFTICA